MAQFMVVLDFTIVNVALPSIQRDLHVATTTLQWLVSAYAVAFGGFLLLGGRLADVYGRARMYRIGLVVFVVASISGGLAVEPVLLIASRVVQGIGAAMLAPAGLSLLVTSWPGEQERSRALGTYGAIVSAGFASGAVLGGLLVEVTWRLVFFVNVPIGIALLAASMRLLPADPPGRGGQLDIPGARDRDGRGRPARAGRRPGRRHAAGHPAGAARPRLAVLLLAAFVIRERRAPAPLLDLALLKDRGIAGANLTFIAVGAFNAAQVLLVTLYLQEGRGLSPVLTGLCFVPQAAGAFALSGPAGLVPALGPRRALAIALSIALAGPGRGGRLGAGRLAARLLAAQFALGVAARISQVAATLAGTRGPVAARSEGTASALLTASRQCGSALGVAIVSAMLVAVHGSTGHRTAVAMFVAAGFALAGLLATRVVPPGPPHPPDAAAAPSVPPPRPGSPDRGYPRAVPGTGDRRRLRLAAGPRLPARPGGGRQYDRRAAASSRV